MIRLTLGTLMFNLLLAEAATVGADSPLTTANIILILGAITSSVIAIITVWRTGKKVDVVAATAAGQDQKLDKITVLVDGRYSEVLQELADVKRLLAAETGRAADRDRAESAQVRASVQAARVEASKATDASTVTKEKTI